MIFGVKWGHNWGSVSFYTKIYSEKFLKSSSKSQIDREAETCGEAFSVGRGKFKFVQIFIPGGRMGKQWGSNCYMIPVGRMGSQQRKQANINIEIYRIFFLKIQLKSVVYNSCNFSEGNFKLYRFKFIKIKILRSSVIKI